MFESDRNTYSTIFIETEALEFWIFYFSFKEDKHNVSFILMLALSGER